MTLIFQARINCELYFPTGTNPESETSSILTRVRAHKSAVGVPGKGIRVIAIRNRQYGDSSKRVWYEHRKLEYGQLGVLKTIILIRVLGVEIVIVVVVVVLAMGRRLRERRRS